MSKDPTRVVEIVKDLMSTNEFQELKKNIERVSRPKAAVEIANEIASYL